MMSKAADNEISHENLNNVHVLEMKVVSLESEVCDLKYRVLENERQVKEEQKRKRGKYRFSDAYVWFKSKVF